MDNCSFCSKTERQGVRLVRGPGVAICDECVRLAHDEILPAMAQPEMPVGGQVTMEVFAKSELGGTTGHDTE